MGLLLEHIELLEGEAEMATILATMRDLGKDVDEVRQYLEKSTGKSLDDITDMELAKIAATGAKQGQDLAPIADRDSDLQKDYKAAQKAMNVPFGANLVAKRVRDMVPSGTYNAYDPDGNPIDIDVDISAGDLKAIKQAAEKAGKTFPQALDALQKGNFSGALRRVIDKTVASD